jgi:tRNA G18 (ribose-2'-O)-methylase SpoU
VSGGPRVSVTRLEDPRLAVYRNVRDAELRDALGVFLAEGRFVVGRLLETAPERVVSLFLTPTALASLECRLARLDEKLPVYVGAPELLSRVVGYRMHQGCLAAAQRDESVTAGSLVDGVPDKGLLLVLEDLANPDNVGALFRNASAFGAAGALLSPGCADPLSRKAVRVSMGEVLRVPFARATPWPGGLRLLRQAGFSLLALTPESGALDLAALGGEQPVASRLALLVGSEGRGLRRETLDLADCAVRIPLAHGVDSLNVATAAAIALHHLGRVLALPGVGW